MDVRLESFSAHIPDGADAVLRDPESKSLRPCEAPPERMPPVFSRASADSMEPQRRHFGRGERRVMKLLG